ncbi:MAG: hypothetical protein VYD87_17705 [Pseudomonadota bacterium]|nr:hypothetical protein [Pseudomonadota bacterium]MEE3098667.1 hypothetical protein [Pseudomonadota bacterium]
MPASRERIGAAMMMGVGDLFVGASGVLICLIVLASETPEDRTLRQVDMEVACAGDAEAGWRLSPVPETGGAGQGDATGEATSGATPEDWVDRRREAMLLLRVGVRVGRGQLDCYRDLSAAVRAHNLRLSMREEGGVSRPALALAFLPER